MSEQNNNGLNMSVIVPIYNVEDHLTACIDSVYKQQGVRLEIILIDDGSTDLSGAIADRYAMQDNRIRVVHQAHKGVSATRNVGLELSRGEYIVFLDSDDWLKDDALYEIYREATANRADIVMGQFLYFAEGRIVSGYFKPAPAELRNTLFTGKEGFIRLMESNTFAPMTWNYIYRRTFLEKIQARCEEGIIHEDELWGPVVLCQAERFIIADVNFYYYRKWAGSLTKTTGIRLRLDSLFRVADGLIQFVDRYDFSDSDSELKNWLQIRILIIYHYAVPLLSALKDSSFPLPELHLERYRRDSREMTPELQRICNYYLLLVEALLKKYTDWLNSEWVASIEPQIKAGKKLMLLYNVHDEDFLITIDDIPTDWVITADRRYFLQAKAVIFHVPDLQNELENLNRPQGQVWVSLYEAWEENHPMFERPEIRDTFDVWICYEQDAEHEAHPIVKLCRQFPSLLRCGRQNR